MKTSLQVVLVIIIIRMIISKTTDGGVRRESEPNNNKSIDRHTVDGNWTKQSDICIALVRLILDSVPHNYSYWESKIHELSD